MSVLDNFSQWREFLNQRIDEAQQGGLSQESIAEMAYHIGNYLSQQVEPRTEEEKLLKDLWNAGTEEEQRALASMMVKLVDHK